MIPNIITIFLQIIKFVLEALSKPKAAIPLPITTNPTLPVKQVDEPTIQLNEIKVNHNFNIKDRASDTLSGSEFVKSIMGMSSGQKREDLILKQILDGNIPDFLREPVEVVIEDEDNKLHYFVMPDVLAVGNNEDFVRIPLSPLTYQKIADSFGAMLPTKKMADQIWKKASVKLEPQPWGPPFDVTMESVDRFYQHNLKIEQQKNGRQGLITGHKKDVIIDKACLSKRDKVVIYGWFKLTGEAIQGPMPNSVSHAITYSDYSHSGRMILRKAILNDKEIDLYELLKDSKLSSLISEQGSYDPATIYH